MPSYHTLKDFLQALEQEGELKRISQPVDPDLEAAQIAVRSAREGGPALLFENTKGSQYPLAMNKLASDRRVELALGMHPQELGERLLNIAEQLMPPKPGKLFEALRPMAKRLVAARASHSREAYSQKTSASPKLSELPILKTW